MSEHHAKAAILSIGDELTLGQTLDTNAKWLADRLIAFGIVTVEHVTVPDDLNAHVASIRRLASSVDLLISTGGLGPTADDLTREALARATEDTLVEDPIAMAEIEAWFTGRGRVLTTINRVQALRPSRARTLPNPHGTAPGLHTKFRVMSPSAGCEHMCDIFALPGPPREMHPMFETQVFPRLRPCHGREVRTRVLHTVGLGESDLASRLGELMDRTRSPLVGTTASSGIVSIRIRYEGPLPPADADGLISQTEAECRRRAGPYIFGGESQTLAERVLVTLNERRQTIAVVESCTGGSLGEAITEVPGSSSAFLGGWITYSDAMKTKEVGVPTALFTPGGPGAVSRECAAAMATGGLEQANSDWCLSITGIAGPEGGSVQKPVGTVYIALAGKTLSSPDIRRFRMGGGRAAVREASVKAALAMLWMHLHETPGIRLLRQVEENES